MCTLLEVRTLPSSVIPGSNPRAKYWGRAGTSRVIFLLSFAALAVAPEAGRPPAVWNDHAAAVSRPAERRAKYGPPTPDARKATLARCSKLGLGLLLPDADPIHEQSAGEGVDFAEVLPAIDRRLAPWPGNWSPAAGRDDHAAAGLAGGER